MRKRIIRKLCAVLYHIIGIHLPASHTYYSFGGRTIHVSFGLHIRRILASGMLSFAGPNINVEKGANFGRNVSLGANSGIGYYSEVSSGTMIGDNVMMGPEVVIFNINHRHTAIDIPMCQQGFEEERPVKIGNDVWIGRRAMIMPGVTIGDGCIIGAGAVVTKDVQPYSVVVGNPAIVVKSRINGVLIPQEFGEHSIKYKTM